MSTKTVEPDKQAISKTKLILGAASLFLFIVGVKRTFKMDEAQGGRTIQDASDAGSH